jgi:hypothetical protein
MSDIQIRSTGTTEVIQSSDGRITLTVPIQIKRRSGRKQMTLPNGQSGQPGKLLRPWDVAATPLQLALARGHRWLAMLAPDIVEAILEDALPDHLTLFDIAVDPPALWEEQRERVCMNSRSSLQHL